MNTRITLSVLGLSLSCAHAQPPGPPDLSGLGQWMSGTVMCVVAVGKNTDGTMPTKLPQGSAFLVNEFGYLLTNSHVVRPQSVVNGRFAIFQTERFVGTFDSECDTKKGTTYSLEVISYDDYVDLSLLKVRDNDFGNKAKWRYIPRTNSNGLQKSQRVAAVGFPDGINSIVPFGTISQLDRERGRLGTDLAVWPGSSGGPVLDERGFVIGVVWGGREDGGKLNLFIPINHARHLLTLAEGD